MLAGLRSKLAISVTTVSGRKNISITLLNIGSAACCWLIKTKYAVWATK